MKRHLTCLIFAVFCFLTFTKTSHALYDPRTVSNNRVGIHIINESDLDDAARLVNSSDGDWGYVTIVITEADRRREKWQPIFERMRKMHLIPLVRIATKVENGVWVKPREDDINNWIDFLSGLNWITENRYVILFNEPNHAKEWGGTLSPEEYGTYLKTFSQKLKEKSPDFFILPAGFDAAAPNSSETMDELVFLARMVKSDPGIFTHIDGWSSHSYPNPGFVGRPYDLGRKSIRGFDWEKNILTSFGVHNLPIFITETGWMHSAGKNEHTNYPDPGTVAAYYETAFTNVWNQNDIVAVTPFLLNYQDAPFDQFSWRKIGSTEYHPIYQQVQNIKKTDGKPVQKDEAVFITTDFNHTLVSDSFYTFTLELENRGQSIFDSEEWKIEAQGFPKESVLVAPVRETVPFERTQVEIRLQTQEKESTFPVTFSLKHHDQVVARLTGAVTIIPPPTLVVSAKLWVNQPAKGNDFKILVYDKNEHVIHEVKNVLFENGQATIERLYNVEKGEKYRFVLIKPYYLPRQIVSRVASDTAQIAFKRLMPLDPSGDGALRIGDIVSFVQAPLRSLRLLFPF